MILEVESIQHPPTPFDDDELQEAYIISVFAGVLTTDSLSIGYHNTAGEYLNKALDRGFGRLPLLTNPADISLYRDLQTNLWRFSAAKQYSQVRTMSSVINARPSINFSEFKRLADIVFDDYNKNFLLTEFNTAVTSSQNAREWQEIQNSRDVFTRITYHTQDDGRVRPAHVRLNNITRDVNDPFWNTYMPPNGWNCRCFVTKHTDVVKETNLSTRSIPKPGSPEVPKSFDMNPGKDRIIFDPKTHPYWRIQKGDSNLRRNNFNLPLP